MAIIYIHLKYHLAQNKENGCYCFKLIFLQYVCG